MTAHSEETSAAKTVRPAHPKVENAARYKLEDSASGGLYRFIGKRAFDVAFVFLTAPVALTLILVLALMTLANGQAPFFRQQRVGRNGRAFLMLKIQTMVPNADVLLKSYLKNNPAARAEWAEKQKLRHDPRVTWLGDYLRRTSLDELPQLWNVLKGDMSVVGPRPMMVGQRDLYSGRAYYALRPGMTGSWQISDRNECSFVRRAAYDTEYNSALSFKTDLHILLRTVRVVLSCNGY